MYLLVAGTSEEALDERSRGDAVADPLKPGSCLMSTLDHVPGGRSHLGRRTKARTFGVQGSSRRPRPRPFMSRPTVEKGRTESAWRCGRRRASAGGRRSTAEWSLLRIERPPLAAAKKLRRSASAAYAAARNLEATCSAYEADIPLCCKGLKWQRLHRDAGDEPFPTDGLVQSGPEGGYAWCV